MRVVLLVLALLVAGCATPPRAPASPTGAALLAPHDGLVRVGAGSTEASFTLGPDGRTMLACSHGNFRAPSPVFLSEDAGATWRALGVPDQRAPSGDCDVAIDGASWLIAYDTLASAVVATTSDRGASWKVVDVAGAPVGGVDRPWLATVAGGKVLMTWCDIMAVAPALCFLASSTDHGATWSAPTPLTVAAPGRALDVMGRMAVAPDGKRVRIPVAWADGYEQDPDVTFSVLVSDDAGATWTELAVAGPTKAPPQFSSVSWAPGGTLWYSYARGAGGPTWAVANVAGFFPILDDVVVTSSRDGGASWAPSSIVAQAQVSDTELSTWIAGMRDGVVGSSALVAWDHMKGQGAWIVDAALVESAGALRIWNASAGREARSGVDYLMTGRDAEGRGLVLFVMDADVLLARA